MRENARFTHVMTNFGCDVRGKRFSAHADVGRFPMTRFFSMTPVSMARNVWLNVKSRLIKLVLLPLWYGNKDIIRDTLS